MLGWRKAIPGLYRKISLLIAIISIGQTAAGDPHIPFIKNKNQWKRDILYKATLPQAEIFLLQDRIQYRIRKASAPTGKSNTSAKTEAYEGGPHSRGAWILSQLYEVNFVGANNNTLVEAEDPSETLHNYFIGNNRETWASGARDYSTVYYRGVYSNIDLKVYSEGDRFKQDWIVRPGADPYLIELNYNGAESVRLSDGKLIVGTNAGEVMELAPYAYQRTAYGDIPVSCSYRLNGTVLSYEFPDGYNPAETLVVDPILIFSGYSGSTYDNWGNSATYDSHGNLYSAGMVTREDGGSKFPTTPGAYKTEFIGGQWDIAILKYDSSGSNVLYATYLGGNGTDSPQSLVVNNAGELVILGATSSSDLPVNNARTFKGGQKVDPLGDTFYDAGSDIFVAKLSETGSALLGMTYLGGSSNDGLNFISGFITHPNQFQESPLARNYGDQSRGDIITDDDNFVYLASNTLSNDFPIVNTTSSFGGGSHDAVVVKLSPDLSTIVWSRFLGGSGTDAAYSIKLDKTNGVYAAGGTTSANFPGMNGYGKVFAGDVDGWIAHLSPDGTQVVHGTYLGTTVYDQTYFIDLSSTGEVYAYGQTKGDYPVLGNVYNNPGGGQFLHKFSADLSKTNFATVIGSGGHSPNISPTAFLVSDCNTIYLSGWGGFLNSPVVNEGYGNVTRHYVGGYTFGLPVTGDAYQRSTSGSDFYFMVLSKDAGQFLYGTFLGGTTSWTHVDGGTSRFDKKGVVYHAVCAGCGGQSDFPAVNVPLSRQKNLSQNCNNAAFKFDLSLLKAHIQTNTVKLNHPGYNNVCMPDTIVFQNKSVGGQIFEWHFGDGTFKTLPDTARIPHRYLKAGKFTVTLKAIDAGTCLGVDSTKTIVNVYKPQGKAGPDRVICTGASIPLEATQAVKATWTNEQLEFISDELNPVVSPTDTTIYYVTLTDLNSCVSKDTLKVSVVPGIDIQFKISKSYDCLNSPTIHVVNQTSQSEDVYFDFGDGTTSTQRDDSHRFQKDSTYIIRLVGKKEFCTYDKKVTMPVYAIKAPNVITPEASPNQNDKFVILYGNRCAPDAGIEISLVVYDRWGKRVYQNSNYTCDWSGENLPSGVYYYDAVMKGEANCKSWLHIIKDN
jgi:CHU_C Type IX secretion signal domain